MLPKLETKSLLSKADAGYYSETLVLEKPKTSIWLVALSSTKPVKSVANLLEAAYYDSKSDTFQYFYQSLKQITDENQEINISASYLSKSSMMIMGYGQAKIDLTRNNQTSTIMVSSEQEWSAVEGKWQPSDEIQLSNELWAKLETETTDPLVHKRRHTMYLGIVVLALLLISVFIGSKTRAQQLLNTKFTALEQQAQQSIAVSQALYTTDQIQARDQLRTTLEQINQSKQDFSKKAAYLAKWQGLYDQVNQVYQTIAGETVLTDFPAWYPLDSIKPGLMGSLMAQAGDNLVVWDEVSSTLVKINVENKRGEIVAGGDSLSGLKSLYPSDTKVVSLTSAGIVEISLNKKTTTTVVPTDSEWLKPQLVGLYGNNLYLIDPGAYSIWRYPAITDGVGAKQVWLGPGVSLPDTNYQRLAIDGQLWLLQKTGKITRFTRGAPQSFNLSGLDMPLGNNTPSFAVHDEKDLVAILDTANQRVILTTKTGVYQKQVVWAGLSQAQDIALSADAATLYILSQGIIYATPI